MDVKIEINICDSAFAHAETWFNGNLKNINSIIKWNRDFNRNQMSDICFFTDRELYRVDSVMAKFKIALLGALCELYMEKKDLSLVIGPLIGRQDYLYNIHYNIFDFDSLKKQLTDIGFSNVYRYDWRDTEHKDVDDYSQAYYPHMDKTNGKLLSLNIESVK